MSASMVETTSGLSNCPGTPPHGRNAHIGGGPDHVLHGLQMVRPVRHVDEDVAETAGRERAGNLRRAVTLQSRAEDRLAAGQLFPGVIGLHVLCKAPSVG